MNEKKTGLQLVNCVLDVFQLICCGVSACGIFIFSNVTSGGCDNPVTGWAVLFGGFMLIGFLYLMAFVLLPICIANIIVSIIALKRYGKQGSAIISLVISVIMILVSAFILL